VSAEFDFNDYLSRLDISAIESPKNKIAECEYFLALACAEADRDRFRWLISAFFGAAYSYFEMSALSAYFAFTAPDTGDPIEDEEALKVLRSYVVVLQDKKRPDYVKTAGNHPVTKRLYELRRHNTHHVPLSIMAAGPSLPQDFHFGYMKGEGVPALRVCREALSLIKRVQGELDA
jgi:hypothetical protein